MREVSPKTMADSGRGRLSVAWLVHVGFWSILVLGGVAVIVVAQGGSWLPPQILHPLGTDEFGRDILATALAAAALSLGKGTAIAAATMALGLFFASLATARGSRHAEFLVSAAAAVVESIPIVLWVMIVLVVLREPRLLVVGTAFCLVVLPSATRVIAGELYRLRAQPYVEAAYQLGAGEARVLFRYMLPNAGPVLLPYGLQVLGGAIAVDGAIGVIGLGNRSDLDLGIFLLRGKENFVQHPQLLLLALAMYGLLFGYLLFAGRAHGSRPDDE